MDNYSKQERTWNYNPQDENYYGNKTRKVSVFWLLVSIVSMTYGIIAFFAYLHNNDDCTPFNCTLYDAGDMFGVVGRDLKFNKFDKIQDYDSLQATLYYYIDSENLEVRLRKVYVSEQSKTYYAKEAKDEIFYSVLAMFVGFLLLIGQLSRSRNNAKVEYNNEFANDDNELNVGYSSSSDDSNAFESTLVIPLQKNQKTMCKLVESLLARFPIVM